VSFTPSAAAPPDPSQIDAIVLQAIARRIFPGCVVLIAHGDDLLLHMAYGTTAYDAAYSQPVRHETIYDVASLTKVFTATAALRLYDTGLLDIEAPAAVYLPALHTRMVSVTHLLTHTSGLDLRLSALRHLGRAGLLEAVYATQPIHPPGSVVAYTNINSLLLGEIIAQITGLPLDQALHELVVAPLGLRNTHYRPAPALRERIAPTEYDDAWRGGLVHAAVHDESAYALGGVAGHAGLFSDAIDLWRFCRAWLPGAEGAADAPPLLTPETKSLACRNHTAELEKGCGLGWMIDRENFMGAAPAGSYGHTGFTGPAMLIVPQSHLIVITLNNRVYPRRSPPEHHAVAAAITNAALRLLH
jgi:CubicO group peptidase (beta-lactamase class C family)